MPKLEFDSRVLALPSGISLRDSGDLKLLADALAESYFKEVNKLEAMEVVLVNIIELPI